MPTKDEAWRTELAQAARDANITFDSVRLVSNGAHAGVMIALLRAFGQDPATVLYAEPRTPDRGWNRNARPTDALVLHPELGALFVEVKSWTIDEIEGIEAGTIYRSAGGHQEAKDPWQQAHDAAQQLQHATRNVVNRRGLLDRSIPFFECVVAFPNISRAAWWERGFDKAIHHAEVLFAEDLAQPLSLRKRLTSLIRSKAGWRVPFSREQLDHVRVALGSTWVMKKRSGVVNREQSSRLTDEINALELEHKRFSAKQRELIETEFDGRPQLIRGVAGSGKTAVLIGNLVNLVDRRVNSRQMLFVDRQPARFAIVCFNQSLAPLLRATFVDAYRRLTNLDPPDCLDIFYLNGLFYHLRKHSALQYQRYEDYEDLPGIPKQRQIASNYCRQLDALAQTDPQMLEAIQYDAVYVDEGQDLFDEKYIALTKLLRTHPRTGEKNLVIFYDDAQNLYGRPRPTWSHLGIQVRGRSEVMRACFRNTRQIVEFAFNLLLGAGSKTKTMTRGFADVSELKREGLVMELTDRWEVRFAEREGPVPVVALADTRSDEKQWVVDRVLHLIEKENIRPSDILLVARHPADYLDIAEVICRRSKHVQRIRTPYGQSGKTAKREFIFQEGELTLASVEAAKGYDCPILFVLGADKFPSDVEGRAGFYVAATRAKLYLLVTGVRQPDTLAAEAEAVSVVLSRPSAEASAC